MNRQPSDNREPQGLFMISVAATLSGVHQQTLRLYEQRGLVAPHRSPGGTRLYSMENVARLRRIQELTAEGISLAGVERLFAAEDQLARAQRRIAALERRLEQTQRAAAAEIERVRRQSRAEVVLYRPPAPPARTRIPVKRPEEDTAAPDDQTQGGRR